MFSVFKKLDYEISNPPETDDSAIATYAGKNKYYNINALDFQASPKNATRTWECGAQYNSLMYSDSVERLYIPNDDELFKYGGFIPTDLWDKDFHYSTLYYPYVPGGPSLGGTEGELYSFNSFVSNSIYTEKQAETWKVYHLKPYLYYRNYLEFLFAEIYRTTGYKVRRDSKFFQPNNPYWTNLIITGNYLKNESDWVDLSSNTLKIDAVTNRDHPFFSNSTHYNIFWSNTILGNPITLDFSNNSLKKFEIGIYFNLVFKRSSNPTYYPGEKAMMGLHKKNYLKSYITIKFLDLVGDEIVWTSNTRPIDPETGADLLSGIKSRINLLSKDSMYKDSPMEGDKIFVDTYKIPVDRSSGFAYLSPDRTRIEEDNNGLFQIVGDPNKMYNGVISMDLTQEQVDYLISQGVSSYTVTFSGFNAEKTNRGWFMNEFEERYYVAPWEGVGMYMNCEVLSKSLEQPRFNFTNLLGDDFNILKGFTDFLKIFNLVCKVDYVSKEIIINEKGEYFSNWVDNCYNWTDYIDFSDINKTNIVSDYKDIVYTYDYRASFFNNQERTESGFPNDTYIYETPFKANNESKSYLEGMYNSEMTIQSSNSESYFWDDMYDDYTGSHTNKPIVYDDNDINGDALEEVKGQLLFRNDSDFPYTWFKRGTNDYIPQICVDTPYELDLGKSYLPLILDSTINFNFTSSARSYPNISHIFSDSGLGANLQDYFRGVKNSICYNSEWSGSGYQYTKSLSGKPGIFHAFHYKWNELIYNSENQLIDATFYLPIDVYKGFDFNRLIIIENNTYMLVEITEYSFNNEVMKAKLLQLRDPSLLDELDEEFGDDYLKVYPTYVQVPPNQNSFLFNFTVISSKPYELLAANSTWVKFSNSIPEFHTTYPAGTMEFSIRATLHDDPTDPAPLPYPADVSITPAIKVRQIDVTDPFDRFYLEKTIYAVSIKEFEYIGRLLVTPVLVEVPNENGTRITSSFMIDSDSLPLLSLEPRTPEVIRNVSIGAPRLNFASGYYIVDISYDSTAGVYGQTQRVKIENFTTANTIYITFRRGYKHEEEITVFNGNNPYFWTWDWTTRSEDECATSEYPFELRCNFKWAIKEWWDTLVDPANGEATYSDFCKGRIYIVDEDSGTAWYPGMDVEGLANRIYRLKVVYPRRYGSANDPATNAFLRLICTDSHAYEKRIRIIANILNNT